MRKGETTKLDINEARHDRKIHYQESQAIAEAWSSAELVLTSGLGHERISHDSDVIARL